MAREKAKNRTKNQQKPSKKGVFSSTSGQLAEFGQIWTCSYPAWPDLNMSISGLAGYGQDHFRPGRIWSRPYPAWLEMAQTRLRWNCNAYSGPYPARPEMDMSISGQTQPAGRRCWKKTPFLEGFCWFFVLFFAFSPTVCIWHGYFEKKSDLACFFWPQGPLIQSSAAPQGLPPPTQQINIRNTNKLSWAIN